MFSKYHLRTRVNKTSIFTLNLILGADGFGENAIEAVDVRTKRVLGIN